MVAYGMGFEAQQDKYPKDENPFPSDSYEAAEWLRGWEDADVENG